MDSQELFAKRLRQAGERVSAARLLVFKTLARRGPLPIPRLAEILAKNAVDPATTYRTINLMRRLGLVHELVVQGKRLIELSHDFSHHHHHFWCRQCGRMIDFDSQAIEKGLQLAAQQLGVSITDHQLEMSGRCQQCTKR